MILLIMLHSIQPATKVHTVYTPAKTMMLGSHFFMEDGFHLSEYGIRISHITGQTGTN